MMVISLAQGAVSEKAPPPSRTVGRLSVAVRLSRLMRMTMITTTQTSKDLPC